MCCVFFQVVLFLLEVSHLPIKSRTPWALCTCWRRARVAPSGTSAASVPSKGFLPKLQALTAVGIVVLVPPHHHALGTVLPHFWAATLLGLFIQWDLLQCHSAVDDVCTLRHVKRWYQPLVFSPKEVEGLSSSLEL